MNDQPENEQVAAQWLTHNKRMYKIVDALIERHIDDADERARCHEYLAKLQTLATLTTMQTLGTDPDLGAIETALNKSN